MKPFLIVIAAVFLTSCAQYKDFASNYDRSYSVGYQDAQGHNIKAGVTLHPIRGLSK